MKKYFFLVMLFYSTGAHCIPVFPEEGTPSYLFCGTNIAVLDGVPQFETHLQSLSTTEIAPPLQLNNHFGTQMGESLVIDMGYRFQLDKSWVLGTKIFMNIALPPNKLMIREESGSSPTRTINYNIQFNYEFSPIIELGIAPKPDLFVSVFAGPGWIQYETSDSGNIPIFLSDDTTTHTHFGMIIGAEAEEVLAMHDRKWRNWHVVEQYSMSFCPAMNIAGATSSPDTTSNATLNDLVNHTFSFGLSYQFVI